MPRLEEVLGDYSKRIDGPIVCGGSPRSTGIFICFALAGRLPDPG